MEGRGRRLRAADDEELPLAGHRGDRSRRSIRCYVITLARDEKRRPV